jgi:hypothetical protein
MPIAAWGSEPKSTTVPKAIPVIGSEGGTGGAALAGADDRGFGGATGGGGGVAGAGGAGGDERAAIAVGLIIHARMSEVASTMD